MMADPLAPSRVRANRTSTTQNEVKLSKFTLLALVNVVRTDRCGQNDVVVVSLRPCNEECLIPFLRKLSETECRSLIYPTLTDKFVDLEMGMSVCIRGIRAVELDQLNGRSNRQTVAEET